MLTMNNTGAIYESRSSIIASSDSKTATVTYLTSSCSQIFFRSSTRGDNPDIYACLSLTFLICSTALSVLSSDVFYSNYGDKNIELGKMGVLAVEMEAAALYYLAAQHHVDALAIMTISDSLVNPDEDTTAEERQNTFTDMMKVGLETLIAD